MAMTAAARDAVHALLRAARRVRATGSAGASAIELAVIAAVLVAGSVLIGGIVYNIVQDRGTTLEDCADQPVGGQCAP